MLIQGNLRRSRGQRGYVVNPKGSQDAAGCPSLAGSQAAYPARSRRRLGELVVVALRIHAWWAEPRLAVAGIGKFDQRADTVGKIPRPKRRQLLHVGDGQRHRLAHQWFAIGGRTARAGTSATTRPVDGRVLRRFRHTQSIPAAERE